MIMCISHCRMLTLYLQSFYGNASLVIPHTIAELLHYGSTHDDVIKWKHFPRYWPFVRGICQSPVNSPHKGQWRGALMFSLICVWINGWVSNREAGDLRRYCAHYDVTVMYSNGGTFRREFLVEKKGLIGFYWKNTIPVSTRGINTVTKQ